MLADVCFAGLAVGFLPWLPWRLQHAGVPCAPILTRQEPLEHPQIQANELLVESEHPSAGPMRQPRPAARFDATPAEIRRPAPLLGEHTDEVLEELDYPEAERAELRADGALG